MGGWGCELWKRGYKVIADPNDIEHFLSSETKEAGTDNRNIIDDGKSQKLTQDDIKALKDKGIKGEVILKGLFNFVFVWCTGNWFLKLTLPKTTGENNYH